MAGRPPHTRLRRRQCAALWCRAALAALLVAACVSAASLLPDDGMAVAAAASRTAPSGEQLAQAAERLRRDEARLEHESGVLHERLLDADEALHELRDQREEAHDRYNAWVVATYKHGPPSTLSLLLATRDAQEAIEAARLARQVAAHQASLLRQLEEADERAHADSSRRDQLLQQLVSTRSSLELVRERIGVNEQAVARQRAERELARARRAARRAAAQGARTPLAGPAAMMAAGMPPFAAPMLSGPPSAPAIDSYLAAKGSPMAGSGMAFMFSGARWGVDPRLLVAIAGAESSFGAQTCGAFNAWGWSCPNDPAQFDSWAHGIDTIASGLRRFYIDEGRTSVVTIHRKYAPVGAANDPTGLNNHWVRNVTKFLLEQGGNPLSVSMQGGLAQAASPLVPTW